MEAFGLDLKLLIAQIVNFLILLALLTKFLYKPILNLLEKREREIKESHKNAIKIQKQEEEILKRKEEILNQSRSEAMKIIEEAKKSGKVLEKEVIEKAQKQAENILEKSKIQIKEEKEKTFLELKKEIADLAILASSQILKRKIDEKSEKNLIEKTIREIHEN